ncbi:MAG TPA: hypothetical protein VGF14_02195 [Alphaproteobacteria bacterium]
MPSSSSPSWFSQTAKTREQTPLQKMAERDPEKAQMFEDTQNQLRQTLSSLNSSKTDFAEQRKASAREKIRRLKEQIKTLRMMAGADPKMIAQQAARLSKELAAAAKEYASAGGTDMVVSSSDKVPATAANGVNTETPPETGGDAEAVDIPPDRDDGNDTAMTQDGPLTEEESAEHVAADPDASFREKMEAYARDIMQQEAAKQVDKDFINEVKKLMDELKNIVRQQRTKLDRDDDPQIKRSLNESDDVMRDIDKSLQTITNNMNAAVPAPAVNISA